MQTKSNNPTLPIVLTLYVIVALCLAVATALPALAQQQSPNSFDATQPAQLQTDLPVSAKIPAGVAPDVQIVVLPYPGGQWGVTAVYSRVVGKKVAAEHMRRLQEVSGWRASGAVEYEERSMGLVRRDGRPLGGSKDKNAPADPPMTSATFTTSAPLVDWRDGTMAWEPFARAFRDKKRVYITYMVPAQFAFRGLRRHSDRDIEVALADNGAAYTYLLNIKNPQLRELRLPRYEIVQPGSERRTASAESAANSRSLNLWGIALGVLLATGAGVVTFLLMNSRAAANR